MYIPYFTAIQTLINQHLSEVKTIDFYNQQYDRYKKLKPNQFPCVYVEFPNPLVWQDASKGMKISDAEITLHVVYFGVEDSPSNCLELATSVHKEIQGRSLIYQTNKVSTGMTLIGSDLLTEYDQIKVMKLDYKTMLLECSAIKQYTKHPVALDTTIE